MQFQKKSKEHRAFSRAEFVRNRIVCRLLAKNAKLLRRDALREANRIMNATGPKKFRGTWTPC